MKPAVLTAVGVAATLVAPTAPCSGQTVDYEVRVERLLDAPIVTPALHPSIGENIQGPSLIRVP
ncbi:MAG: hypothetical protein VX815_06910, partial [Gemmatimonadota bacterium]|nr:hypothetical protein [Gemmatimonadota bacterium]